MQSLLIALCLLYTQSTAQLVDWPVVPAVVRLCAVSHFCAVVIRALDGQGHESSVLVSDFTQRVT